MKKIENNFYVMDTFVRSCPTEAGAWALAKFLESKFPLDPKMLCAQVHEFVVVGDISGKIQVHSKVEVNDIGREDFKKFVAEFTAIQMRKPALSRFAGPSRLAA
jgi:hypothetical protein